MSLEDISFEQRDELARLMKDLSDNPNTRKEVLRLTKQVRPDLTIPELEIESSTKAAFDKAEQRVQALEAKLREKDALAELQRRRDALKEKNLVGSDKDVEEVEKLMLEKNIANHETAAEYWAWMKQSAAPTPSSYNPSAIGKFDLSSYWKNPQTAARNEAAKALAELRRNNSRPF